MLGWTQKTPGAPFAPGTTFVAEQTLPRQVYLCPSGRFLFRSEFLSNSINGSGATASKLEGGWKVSARGGVKLVLQFTNGRVDEYKVSAGQSNDVISLNGNRYLVQTLERCP